MVMARCLQLACRAGAVVALAWSGTWCGALSAEEARQPIPPNPRDISPGVTLNAARDGLLAAGPGDLGLSVFVVAQDCGNGQIFDGLRIAGAHASVMRVQARARNGVRIFYDGPVMVDQVIRIPVNEFVWTGFTGDGDDNLTAVRTILVCRAGR